MTIVLSQPALLQILNDGNDALLILQDLSAAFYTIEHTLLFQRLHSELCFDSTVLKWFTSYLSGRLLDISCHLRLLFFVEFRRDQCSVLSSFPFISDSWQSSFKSSALSTTFFADDSELYSCPPTERESALKAVKKKKKKKKEKEKKVESSCQKIKNWMPKNKLKLNEQKTEVLLYGPPTRRESVPVDSLSIGEASIPFSSV